MSVAALCDTIPRCPLHALFEGLYRHSFPSHPLRPSAYDHKSPPSSRYGIRVRFVLPGRVPMLATYTMAFRPAHLLRRAVALCSRRTEHAHGRSDSCLDCSTYLAAANDKEQTPSHYFSLNVQACGVPV